MNRKEKFEDLQLDFYRWMIDFGGIKPGTSQTYISKMKFLSDFYNLDFTISEEYIDYILKNEDKNRVKRTRYSKPGAIGDF